jgi:hypothetical protein
MFSRSGGGPEENGCYVVDVTVITFQRQVTSFVQHAYVAVGTRRAEVSWTPYHTLPLRGMMGIFFAVAVSEWRLLERPMNYAQKRSRF